MDVATTPVGESAVADAQAAADALASQAQLHPAAPAPAEPPKPKLTEAQKAKNREIADRAARNPDEYEDLQRALRERTTDPVQQLRSEFEIKTLRLELVADSGGLVTRAEAELFQGTPEQIKQQFDYVLNLKKQAAAAAKSADGSTQPQAATVPASTVTPQAPARVAPPPLPVPGATAHEPTIKELAVAACEAWKADRAAGLIPDG